LQDVNGSAGMTSSTQTGFGDANVFGIFATKVTECSSFDIAALLSTSAKTCRQSRIDLESQIDRRLHASAKKLCDQTTLMSNHYLKITV